MRGAFGPLINIEPAEVFMFVHRNNRQAPIFYTRQ
jgi:hypothetical protein